MQEPQALPARFPCWVRAKFSYGGESKHDLGFMEGDLIECLNAGDGSWWMGRLWRDKRVKGLFPSNFVDVLDANFRPAMRSTSPMPHLPPGTSPINQSSHRNIKPKLSRKPYQSYSAPFPAVTKREGPRKQDNISSGALARAPTPHDSQTRVKSHIHNFESKAKSNPGSSTSTGLVNGSFNRFNNMSNNQLGYNYPCAMLPISNQPGSIYHATNSVSLPSPDASCTASPVVAERNYYMRTPSPSYTIQDEEYGNQSYTMNNFIDSKNSSPPPAPPPHRTVFTPQAAQTNDNFHANINKVKSRGLSPTPSCNSNNGLTSSSSSLRVSGQTPSPLRSAMDDVMSSLADMGLSHDNTLSESSSNFWSPEEIDLTYSRAWRPNDVRTDLSSKSNLYDNHFSPESEKIASCVISQQEDRNPPSLSNYVQRMENRLNRVESRCSYPYEDDQRLDVNNKMTFSEQSKPHTVETGMSSSKLAHRRSAYEIGKSMLSRTFTIKTNLTDSSSGTRSTVTNNTSSTDYSNYSLMSGPSASGLSNTSAASLQRKRLAVMGRSQSAFGTRKEYLSEEKTTQEDIGNCRSATPLTGISYHGSHASEFFSSQPQRVINQSSAQFGTNILGGLMPPKVKKSGFFKKMIETAKTGAATARNSINVSELVRPVGASKSLNGTKIVGVGPGNNTENQSSNDKTAAETDWVQVRRDVNRSNSLSEIERMDRRERSQMIDNLTIQPVDELSKRCNGDEGADGHPVAEATNFLSVNYTLVDKNSRFINNLPPMTNSVSLATGFLCRPYRSDVQRLRAIFTWVSEKIAWEEDFESEIDSRRVILSKRGCSQEVALLVMEMCAAVGIHAEVIHGHLKTPGETSELNITPPLNHWWNAVIIDGEWRIMDCSLAAPSHPRRSLYSSASCQVAENWWFLTRPMEICWTHIPQKLEQQHLCPPISPQILLALPCACPSFFKNRINMIEYDTSLVRIEDLELVHIKFGVPADVECVAEVEAKAFARDIDGDFFDTGDIVKKRALAQAEWIGNQKQYTVKALLPGDEGHGVLKIYAGKRGLMHSSKDIPHPVAFTLPIIHTGSNPPYEFFTRHPTPHAQRHDLYVAQPQCQRLALNNTFVFAIRQHPSSIIATNTICSDNQLISSLKPGTSSSISNPKSNNNSTFNIVKPAKLAIQSPSGKVLRLMRKEERNTKINQEFNDKGDEGTWETIIKVSERGVWRGLVLADRTARWCVFAEWNCT